MDETTSLEIPRVRKADMQNGGALPLRRPGIQPIGPRRCSVHRRDLQVIADLISPGSKVLDLGCGNGELLEYLIQHKKVRGRGI